MEFLSKTARQITQVTAIAMALGISVAHAQVDDICDTLSTAVESADCHRQFDNTSDRREAKCLRSELIRASGFAKLCINAVAYDNTNGCERVTITRLVQAVDHGTAISPAPPFPMHYFQIQNSAGKRFLLEQGLKALTRDEGGSLYKSESACKKEISDQEAAFFREQN